MTTQGMDCRCVQYYVDMGSWTEKKKVGEQHEIYPSSIIAARRKDTLNIAHK